MHSHWVSVMGNISLELLGDCGKVSIICLGTHQCLVKKWGLMTVQQRGGKRLNLSQSMSRNMIVNLRLLSVFTVQTCVNSFVQGQILVNRKHQCYPELHNLTLKCRGFGLVDPKSLFMKMICKCCEQAVPTVCTVVNGQWRCPWFNSQPWPITLDSRFSEWFPYSRVLSWFGT